MPLQIQSPDPAPIHALTHQHAGPQGSVITAQLPIYLARVDGLPPALDAIVCTSDVQGMEPPWSTAAPRLVGELLAEELVVLAGIGSIPPLERTGVILAGDFFSAPAADQLGVSGDVRGVWAAFQRLARWVVGVAGNHDQFGTAPEFATFREQERLWYLDGTTCTVDQLVIAGIGGIIGKPTKPWRRTPEQYAAVLQQVLHAQPDLLVVHESPALPEWQERGSPILRTLLDRVPGPLTICGHAHWKDAYRKLPNGTPVLNVDARVIILVRS